MSHLTSKWAWKQNVGNPVRKLILLFLADAANPDYDFYVWHSFRSIAAACGCSRGTVGNHMAWLVKYRFLVLTHQGCHAGDTNRYLLNWQNEQIDRPSPVHPPTQEMDGDDKKTVHLLGGGCTPDGQDRPSGDAHRPSVVDPPSISCAQTSNTSGKEPVKVPVNDGLPEPAVPAGKIEPEKVPKSRPVWQAYAGAYERRYGAAPLQNQKINSQLCLFVDRVGMDDAPLVAMHYLTSNKRWYVEKRHPVGVMLENAEALHNEWSTGTTSTSTEAAQLDRRQSNYNVAQDVIDELIAEGKL